MPDYSKSKIYAALSSSMMYEGLVYVGSTTKTLSECMSQHSYSHRRAVAGKKGDGRYIKKIFDEYGEACVTLDLLEDFPCSSRPELKARLEEWRQNLNPVNTMKAFVPEGDRKRVAAEVQKRYARDNPEKMAVAYRKYRDKCRVIRYRCECGSEMIKRNQTRHNNSKKHREHLTGERCKDRSKDVTRVPKWDETLCRCGIIIKDNNMGGHLKTLRHVRLMAASNKPV